MRPIKYKKLLGFTMVELVVVIVLIGVIAPMIVSMIARPVLGYAATTRRAELVDIADMSLRKIAREVRNALPNSIRLADSGGGSGLVTCTASGTIRCALEMINTVDGARYRDEQPGDILDLTVNNDKEFDILGVLSNFAAIDTDNDFVVIYNINTTGASNNAYQNGASSNRSSLNPAATTNTHIQMDSAFVNTAASPTQRFFVVDTPLSYICDAASGTLTRYSGYSFTPAQSTSAGSFTGATAAVLANRVSSCTFTYQAGASQRSALLSIQITLTLNGESANLLHQVHVNNVP